MNEQIEKILRTAIEYGASDVFLSCGSRPALKINGKLVMITELPEITEEIFDDYMKIIADDDDLQIFADKHDNDFSADIEGIGRFRVNLFMQSKGPSASLRPIPNEVKTLDELHLPEKLKSLCNLESGLVLVTGPAGVGKSTTIASMVNEVNRTQTKHIITIEDPIEFVFKNESSLIEQREVRHHSESFETALKAALREAPDVILVGEMRDLETIALAVTAAETGHLVFATLHTSGGPQTIDRIIDVFPPEQQSQIKTQLAMSLKAIIWQKLIRTADEKNRIPACEILIKNNAIANLIRKGSTHQIYAIMETSRASGMQTMSGALNKFVDSGQITRQEANRHLGDIFKEEEPN
ncbi:PilT/PilU family type 4a pilus ATPase [Candidatus Peregrinibacteria bacterium]|jgi:twitching motility protein PilT|nr:PilT/PilU family type 4a pilus ATPase [Candidatus Peregrinibacteria bacterium]